jgi:hypothetical protein
VKNENRENNYFCTWRPVAEHAKFCRDGMLRLENKKIKSFSQLLF